MTDTKIKIFFWSGNDYGPTLINTDPATLTSTLRVDLRDDIEVWDNVRNQKGTSFPVDENPGNNMVINDLNFWFLEITGPTEKLKTILNIILLKSELDQTNECFQLVIDKNLGNQENHWDIEDRDGDGHLTLKLSEADFGGNLDASKIIIDNDDYEDDGIQHGEDYDNEKQALLDLERTLKNLENKYKGLKEKGGPDFEFPEPVELGKPGIEDDEDPTNNREATGLQAYPTSLNTNIKNVLFNLNDEIRGKIDSWINDLKFVRSCRKVGIKNKSTIAILEKEGYDFSDEEFQEIKKQKLYKGFPLLDPNLRVFIDSDNNFKVEEINSDKPVRYTKDNIDLFRSPTPGYTEVNHDIFTKKKMDKDSKGRDIEIFANSKPEECLGFQPGDFSEIDDDKLVTVNGNWFFSGDSKIYYDIFAAQNVEEAMNLAFFGKDYDFAQSDFSPAKRKENPRNGWIKTPNTNLKFDEVKGLSRKDTLDHYFEAFSAKSGGDLACQWRNPGDDAGNGAADALKWDDPDTQQEIKEAYKLAGEWIKDYEEWEKANFNDKSEGDLKKIKTDLEGWKGTRIYEGVWGPVIETFLDEIEGVLRHITFKAELANLKNRGSKLAQKIYQNLTPNGSGFTQAVFSELKNLVRLLDEAFGTTLKDSTKNELNNFNNSTDANKKEALKIAKRYKNQDSDPKNCVDTALEKLKTPQQNKLEEARQNLKDLLNGLRTGGQDAYQVVVADIQNSETDLKKASQIFEKLEEIDGTNEDDDGELLNALNNLKNNAGNGNAWNAINKYKRDGQSQGYGDEMLKKLKDYAEKRKKIHHGIQNAKTKSQFEVAKTEFMKNHEYRHGKENYEQIYFPLLEKAAEIREKGNGASQDEKNLSQLMSVIMSDYNDSKTQLGELEEKLNKIKEYAPGRALHNVIQNYSETQKTALTKLIHKMEAKVQEWQKIESENNNSSPLPWYNTTAGIAGIILVSVAIVGAAVYYYLVKSKEWREE